MMQNSTEKKISRREALKLIGTVTGGAIPMAWAAPIIDKSTLPVHATTSEMPVLYAVNQVFAQSSFQNSIGENIVKTNDVFIATFKTDPAQAGVPVKAQLILNQPGHPRDGGEIVVIEGVTGPDGTFTFSKALFEVGGIQPGLDRLTLLWTYDSGSGAFLTITHNIGLA